MYGDVRARKTMEVYQRSCNVSNFTQKVVKSTFCLFCKDKGLRQSPLHYLRNQNVRFFVRYQEFDLVLNVCSIAAKSHTLAPTFCRFSLYL